MSIVTIQLGQCGNQIGCSLFSALSNECLNNGHFSDFNFKSSEMFFDIHEEKKSESPVYKARSVLIDSEEKVISQVVNYARTSDKWCYDPNSQISYKRGSGNNWAQGYCVYGPQLDEVFGDVVRKQVEKCDRFSGFLTLMSLAGGTGSGAGSYLTNFLQDHYPHSFLINQVVWPYSSGEVAVQNYNAVLSLGRVYQSSDLILAFDNDNLHKICTNQLSIEKVSFSDVNKILSKHLASFLLPSFSSFSRLQLSDSLGESIREIAPHPEYKMVSMVMAPLLSENVLNFTSFHWPAVLKNLKKLSSFPSDPDKFDLEWQLRYSSDFRNKQSIADLLIIRGHDLNELNEGVIKSHCFKSTHSGYPDYNLRGFNIRTHSKPFSKLDKSGLLVNNGCSQMAQMVGVVDRAWNMFSSRAYLHQYKKYGIEEDDFVDCFVTLEQVAASYANL